jgi:hypothetical protein
VKRRSFITLLGGAAATWPVVARGQQAKLPTIGYLGATAAVAERARTDAFVQRLRELGWREGNTVAIEYRWGESRTERYAEIATDLVRLPVDIILATSTAAALACKQATAAIPYDLAINLKTAKALGLIVPPTLLARADESRLAQSLPRIAWLIRPSHSRSRDLEAPRVVTSRWEAEQFLNSSRLWQA